VIMIMTMIVTVTVTEFVEVEMAESLIDGIHLYFKVAGGGKERGLYPPSIWRQRIKYLELPLGWNLRTRWL
jgi:hypothetical protein